MSHFFLLIIDPIFSLSVASNLVLPVSESCLKHYATRLIYEFDYEFPPSLKFQRSRSILFRDMVRTPLVDTAVYLKEMDVSIFWLKLVQSEIFCFFFIMYTNLSSAKVWHSILSSINNTHKRSAVAEWLKYLSCKRKVVCSSVPVRFEAYHETCTVYS